MCVHHSKAALSCADQAVHAAHCHSPGLIAGIQPPGVSSFYPPIAPRLRPLCGSVHSTDHRSSALFKTQPYTGAHAAKVNQKRTRDLGV